IRELATSSPRTARRRRTVLRSYTKRLWSSERGASSSAAPPVSRILVGAVNDLELLEAPARADGHARQRTLRQVRGHLRLLADPISSLTSSAVCWPIRSLYSRLA